MSTPTPPTEGSVGEDHSLHRSRKRATVLIIYVCLMVDVHPDPRVGEEHSLQRSRERASVLIIYACLIADVDTPADQDSGGEGPTPFSQTCLPGSVPQYARQP